MVGVSCNSELLGFQNHEGVHFYIVVNICILNEITSIMSVIDYLIEGFLSKNFESLSENEFSSKGNSIKVHRSENKFEIFFTILKKQKTGLFKSEIVEENIKCNFDYDSLISHKFKNIKDDSDELFKECIKFLEHLKSLKNRKRFCSIDINRIIENTNERQNFKLDEKVLTYKDKSGTFQEILSDSQNKINNSFEIISRLVNSFNDSLSSPSEEFESEYKEVFKDITNEIILEFIIENNEDFIFCDEINEEEKPNRFEYYNSDVIESIVSNDFSILIKDGRLKFYDWLNGIEIRFDSDDNFLFSSIYLDDNKNPRYKWYWVNPDGLWRDSYTEKERLYQLRGEFTEINGKVMNLVSGHSSSRLISLHLLNNKKFNEMWRKIYDFPFQEKLYSYLKHHIESENQKRILNIINKNEEDISKTKDLKKSILKELDKDSDGRLDIVQTDEYQDILKKHEKTIIEIDRDYIKNFVKLSNFLKTKRNNLQNTFEILSKVEFSNDLEPLTQVLKNNIHTYNSLLFHSLTMVVSITNDEMITFYEIYEIFDELNVFDSKHEKDMLNGIKTINSNLLEMNTNLKEISGHLLDLMTQMKESDERIIESIDNLTYTTSSSIESLSNTVQSELNSINSSIKFNNLLTGIQSYQMYKINLNTKSLRG